MLRRTFFVSSSSENRKQTIQLADWMISRGYRWALEMNWTNYSTKTNILPHTAESALLAVRDVAAAVAADVFIYLATADPSRGAHAEFGARLGTGGEVHLIQQDAPYHLFYEHPLVLLHPSVDDFTSYMTLGRRATS